MLNEENLICACVDWVGSVALCLPEVPIVKTRTNIVITTDEAIAETYEDLQAFLKAEWSHIDRIGKRTMLQRAINAVDSVDFLKQVIPSQWTLARATKPGFVNFSVPQPTSEERPVYRSGMSTLDLVGYIADEQAVEFSCAISGDRHVNGWEIFDIWNLLDIGELPDGRKVSAVRVVFIEQKAAEREKRPLLDAGAKVLYYDEVGELVEIFN